MCKDLLELPLRPTVHRDPALAELTGQLGETDNR